MSSSPEIAAVTVTLNPAIDQTVTIPGFAAGRVNRVEHERSNPGGKGVNVASNLADWGERVAVTGFLGIENPAPFEALFAAKQIDDYFVRIAGETRKGIKIVDPISKQTTDINFPGAAPAETDLASLLTQIENLALHAGRYFVLAGSVPPGVDPGIYGELIALLKSRGCKVALDTSGQPLTHALQAVPHIIKPNIHELGGLLGESLANTSDVIRAGRKLNENGIEIVAVSMGSEGACFLTAHEAVIARSPDIEVKSTVGAGDAMVAGIVAAQLAKLSLADCARLASAFSLDVLTRPENGRSTRASIEAAMAAITVRSP